MWFWLGLVVRHDMQRQPNVLRWGEVVYSIWHNFDVISFFFVSSYFYWWRTEGLGPEWIEHMYTIDGIHREAIIDCNETMELKPISEYWVTIKQLHTVFSKSINRINNLMETKGGTTDLETSETFWDFSDFFLIRLRLRFRLRLRVQFRKNLKSP